MGSWPAMDWIAVAAVLAASALSFVEADRARGLAAQVSRLEEESDARMLLASQNREALDGMADGLDVLVFLVDRDLTVIYANAAASRTFGVEDPSGSTLLATTLSHELNEAVGATVLRGEGSRLELTLRHPEERTFAVQVWAGVDGSQQFYVSLYDMTSLRRLERVRSDFVANVSHELRTPMTTIRAMAETLQDDEDAELRHGYLAKIIGEVDRLTRITEDLLTLSTAESGVPEKVDCDGAEIVRVVTQQLASKAERKGLVLEYSGLTNSVLRANETQLAQVAFNLIDNAINYTSEGRVSVRTEATDSEFVLTVSDTGIGIGSEHMGRVFERFYRVDKGRSRASGGTGLGLSIVRHITEAHGGKVTLESELNKGSTFRVVLPTG